MGLAKVLLGRGGKDAGRSKCTRVDSLGLARRRLAAKAAQEELVIEVPDPEEPESAAITNSLERSAGEDSAQQSGNKDDDSQRANALMNRQRTDSLRLHRRRFRERASLDLPASRFHSATVGKGISFSGGASPSAQTGDDECSEVEDAAANSPSGSRQVRFRRRRASDGEYLTRHSSKGTEASFPNALKVVQLKAERLFKRLTGSFIEPPARPRSANFPRPGSPSRTQRSSASRISTSRPSSTWISNLRQPTLDPSGPRTPPTHVAAPASPPFTDGTSAPGAATTAPGGGTGIGVDITSRRAKRQSAPGELFHTTVNEPQSAGPESPSSPPGGTVRRNRSVTSGGKDSSVSKGRNWLARLSRGLQGGAASPSSSSRPSLGRAVSGSLPTSPHAGGVAMSPMSPHGGGVVTNAETTDQGRVTRERSSSLAVSQSFAEVA